MNGNGMIHRADGMGDQVIAGERLAPLRSSCADLHARVNSQCCDKCKNSETDEQEFPLQRHHKPL
jgi:hypothetical protein